MSLKRDVESLPEPFPESRFVYGVSPGQGASPESCIRKQRFIEEQTIGVQKSADAGLAVKEACRQHRVNESTRLRWKKNLVGWR